MKWHIVCKREEDWAKEKRKEKGKSQKGTSIFRAV
jgi:hypothetical protein